MLYTKNILYLIEKYPEKDWNIKPLSSLEHLPLEFIINNINLDWDWDGSFSYIYEYQDMHPAITLEFIKNNIDKNFDWNIILSRSKKIINMLENDSELLEIIEQNYDNKNKVYYYLSSNPNLTEELITKYINKNWLFTYIGCNINISEQFIEQNKIELWYSPNIVNNPNVSHEFILKYFPDLEHNFTINPNFDFNAIDSRPNENWNWSSLSKNSNLSWGFVKQYLDKPWNWIFLSKHICVTYDIIKEYKNLPWDRYSVTENPNIINNPEIILSNINEKWTTEPLIHYYANKNPVLFEILDLLPEKSWTCGYLSYDTNLKLDFVKKYINKNWCWGGISSNSNITIEDIENNPKLPWNYEFVIRNPNITFEYVKKCEKKFIENYGDIEYKMDLFYYYSSANSAITLEIVENNINSFNWCYKGLLENENITIEFVEKYIDKIECSDILENIIGNNPTPKNIKFRTHKYLEKIKEELIEYAWNPDRVVYWCLDIEKYKEIKNSWKNK